MPLHDWAGIPDNIFHTFHLGWLWNLAGTLNSSLLPEGYVARAEEYVGPYQADVLTLETGGGTPPRPAPSAPPAPVPTLTIMPPRFVPHKERRLAVFSARDERRVAVIEVVSPGNKDSQGRAEWFRGKLLEYLEGGLHLTLLDILPSSTAVPAGFAAGLVGALGSSEALPRAERQAVSFECELEPPRVRVYSSELSIGRALPEQPLFLEPGRCVSIPLEGTYQETIQRLPATDRARLRS